MTPVTLYTTSGCSACAAVRRYLESKGLADVAANPSYLDEMKRLSGVRIAPVTVVGEQALYGTFEQQRPQLEAILASLRSKP